MRSLNLAALPEEDALFLRRLTDMSELSGRKGLTRFTAFLTERQQYIAGEFIRVHQVENAVLYGGYDGAVRKMCGFFPVFEGTDLNDFPISPVSMRYPPERELTHRDFLGTLLALGIKRESLGDILPAKGRCSLFISASVAPLIMEETVKIGGVGVSRETGVDLSSLPAPEFTRISGTVGSARMDSLVKLLTGYAREKSAALIRGGLVKLDDLTVTSVSEAFETGSSVSIRGFGKYTVDGIGAPTRKGRLPVEARKYI